MHRLSLLTFLLLSMPLAGCETLGLTTPAPPDFAADTGPICPATAVLSDAVIVTKLKPGTQAALPNAANVAFGSYYVDDFPVYLETTGHFDDFVVRPTILTVATRAQLGPRAH